MSRLGSLTFGIYSQGWNHANHGSALGSRAPYAAIPGKKGLGLDETRRDGDVSNCTTAITATTTTTTATTTTTPPPTTTTASTTTTPPPPPPTTTTTITTTNITVAHTAVWTILPHGM